MHPTLANLARTFLLPDLVRGLRVTFRNLFARKVTVQFPEERIPK